MQSLLSELISGFYKKIRKFQFYRCAGSSVKVFWRRKDIWDDFFATKKLSKEQSAQWIFNLDKKFSKF